jgi:hypothetical protein
MKLHGHEQDDNRSDFGNESNQERRWHLHVNVSSWLRLRIEKVKRSMLVCREFFSDRINSVRPGIYHPSFSPRKK